MSSDAVEPLLAQILREYRITGVRISLRFADVRGSRRGQQVWQDRLSCDDTVECPLKHSELDHTHIPEMRGCSPHVHVLLSVAMLGGTLSLNAARPNVLLIVVDDLRAELPMYGASHVHAPNLEKLVLWCTHSTIPLSHNFDTRHWQCCVLVAPTPLHTAVRCS